MDIKTLEALGINADELANRVVDQAVDALLYSTGFNPETEEEVTYESNFKRAIEKKIQGVVDQKISEIAEAHIMPRVGEMIEKADMRKTNMYGEPQTPSLTFKEYMAYRAENYMTEDVDFQGRSKADLEAKGESTYNWRKSGPRLTVLMKMHIADSMDKAAKAAVNDVNTAIAKSIEKAAKEAIASAASAIKVSVGA